MECSLVQELKRVTHGPMAARSGPLTMMAQG